MTDEQSPASPSRRARLATRRQRLRFVGLVVAAVLVLAGVGTATALHGNDDGPVSGTTKQAAANTTDPSTTAFADVVGKHNPPRPLSHADPLKLWIGGDSLAGSFGPALGQMAGATGVVDATIDYKVSSGLADNGIRDWYEHAQEAMASENPDAVVFIIGTNDASIANSTYDSNHDGVPDWEADYREKIDRMMATFVGGSRHRTVYWLGPPTLGDSALDSGAKALGPVMRQEAKKFAPDVQYFDTYRLFSDSDGGYSSSLPDAQGNLVQMRISDGVHFTVDGAQYLANAIWKLLNKRWDITAQADPSQPINYTIAPGSNEEVPGVGHYRPPVSSETSPKSSSSTTTPSSEPGSSVPGEPSTTGAVTGTSTPSTKPTTSTPGTKPTATTPVTSPPVTTPPKKPPPKTPKT